jgi:formate hydrogenlyase transcriptional activator
VENEDLLSLSSLFKTGFSIDWLIQLTGKKASAVINILEAAVGEGLLKKHGFSRFSFSDQRQQEALKTRLKPEVQDLYIRKIADLLLKELPDDEEKAELVAGYLLGIKNDFERCRWLAKAGDIYAQSLKINDALKCYIKVLDDLLCIKDARADSLIIETSLKYSRIAEMQFDIRRILPFLTDALKRAEQRRDLRSAALLHMHIAKFEWYQSNYLEAIRRFQKGWAISQGEDDEKLKGSAVTFSTFFHYWQGYYKEAVNIYESEISGMTETPPEGFPLMAEATMGNCFTLVGHVAHGFGMMEAVRLQAIRIKSAFLQTYSEIVMAIALLNIQRNDEAINHLNRASADLRKWPKSPLTLIHYALTAYGHYHDGNPKKAVYHLKKYLGLRKEIGVSMLLYPYFLELCWAMELKRMPKIAGASFQDEFRKILKSKNVFMIGVAHRFQALLQEKNNAPEKEIQRSLNTSEKWLIKSGHMAELFRTRLALYNLYLSSGRKKKVLELRKLLLEQASGLPRDMIPRDLKPLETGGADPAAPAGDVQVMGKKVMDIPDHGVLMRYLITSACRLIGAERGGIFLIKKMLPEPRFFLHAGANLTKGQISESGFEFAWRAIHKVARTGQGILSGQDVSTGQDVPTGQPEGRICSLICVPLKQSGKTIGALYHDNRMLTRAFEDHHLLQLTYITAVMSLAVSRHGIFEELNSIIGGFLDPSPVSSGDSNYHGIIGQSRGIQRVFSQIERVSRTDASVIILGETGTGKDMVARGIHEAGHRKNGPFITVNCNALPDSLISSELFGFEKGAFTGAFQRKPGRFELAEKGTLFLDEIGELPIETQVKLLRVLQEKEFERIGGNRTIQSDFRLITATNRQLDKEVEAGRFREDLFYRLNVFPILVPPLRERKDDIPILARHFLQVYAQKIGKRFKSFPENEMEKLIRHKWPGNVRELENVIERGTISSQSAIFRIPELTETPGPAAISGILPDMRLKDVERRHILNTLEKINWKIRGPGGAAELLDIHPSTLYSRMKKLGINIK